MPLPVERSQGSVSSLVARFQTAADRDAEHARRQSLPPPSRRTSSNTFIKPEVTSVPEPVQAKDAGVVAKPSVEGHVNGNKEQKGEGLAKRENDGKSDGKEDGKGAVETLKEKGKGLVEGVKDLTVGGGKGAKEANEAMAKEDAGGVGCPAGKTPTKASKGDNLTTNGKNITPAKSTPTKMAAAKATPAEKAGPAKASSTPSAAVTSGTKAAAPTASASSTRSRIGTTPKPSTPAPKSPTNPTRPRGTDSAAKTSTTTSAVKAPTKATPGSSTKSPPIRTQRLTPAMTGPLHRTPSSTSGPTEPMPLKPHLTGTPSKPTASYLAKTRTPTSTQGQGHERRESSSLSRGPGSAMSARARSSTASPSPASGTKSPPTRSTLSTSGSRLLQGTAASRAKAAEVKSPPTKIAAKSVKASTPTPTKAGAASTARTRKEPSDESGSTGSDAPLRAPVGMRMGFAAAGMGKGGKTGKELNEEQNEKLRNGEITGGDIVRQADEPAVRVGQGAHAAEDQATQAEQGDAVEASQNQVDPTDPTNESSLVSTSPHHVGTASEQDDTQHQEGDTPKVSVADGDAERSLSKHSVSDAVDSSPSTTDERKTGSSDGAKQDDKDETVADLEEIPDL